MSSGTLRPLSASGAMPTARPTAARPRTRPGIIFELNIGATMKRGDPGDHEHEARDLLLRELLEERVRVHGPTICGIEAHSAVVYVSIWPSIQGPKSTITATSAMTFGMNASVCSWICVTDWKIDTIRPTTRPAISIGIATFIATEIASIARETTTSWFISGSSPQAIG